MYKAGAFQVKLAGTRTGGQHAECRMQTITRSAAGDEQWLPGCGEGERVRERFACELHRSPASVVRPCCFRLAQSHQKHETSKAAGTGQTANVDHGAAAAASILSILSSAVQHRHTLLLVEPWSGRCEGTDKNRPWVCARASFVGHREASEHLSTQALTSPDRGSLRDASLANTGWRPQAKKKNSIRDEIVRNRQSIFCNGMASSLPYGRAHVFFKRVPSLPDTAPSL